MDDSGRILKSYGGPKGSGVDQLDWPCHLAVDKHGYVLVADFRNNRVVLLSRELTHIGYIQTPGHQLMNPWSLHLDEVNHRLYVGETSGRLVLSSPTLT